VQNKFQQYLDKNFSIDNSFDVKKTTTPLSRPYPASPPFPKENGNGNGLNLGEGEEGEVCEK